MVSIGGPEAFGNGAGRQWFSVQDVTEENRAARIADVMPQFVAVVRHWQRLSGVGYAGTALVGFSQGAIMALEALKRKTGWPGAWSRSAGVSPSCLSRLSATAWCI